ncbi:MAG: ABC transporter ATP-binding protein [Candidatus Binatia bacterium]
MLAALSHIHKHYTMGSHRLEVLKDVSLILESGESLAIQGPSGSGKSTLLHILGCLEKPSAGEVRLDNLLLSSLDDAALSRLRNSQIGFVFQAFHLIPRLSVLENVEVPLLYTRLVAREARRRAIQAIESVGLAGRMQHRPTELSGGERQRVAIARALVNNPALILADEPTGNLDMKTGREIMEIFQRLHADGKAVVVVTHNPEIAAFARRQMVLEDGRVCE